MDDTFHSGGGWGHPAGLCGSDDRFNHLPVYRNDCGGFRVVKDSGLRVVKEVEPSLRTLRGGCWISYAENCRSEYLGRFRPSLRDCSRGFRVVKETPNG